MRQKAAAMRKKRFVYLQNGRQRLVFMGAGLLEYEASDGEKRCRSCRDAVARRRAVRLGSLHDRLRPPGLCALYPQDSQLLGNWEMEYALAFDTPDSELSMLAERYHTPELYYQDTAHPAQMQESAQNLFCLDVPEFVVSCVQGAGRWRNFDSRLSTHRSCAFGCDSVLPMHSDRVAHRLYR